MHQPKEIIKVFKTDEYFQVSYIRPSDNQVFDYKVKIESNVILWANLAGRWRNDPRDEKITYRIENEKLIIIQDFGGGSIIKKEFSK